MDCTTDYVSSCIFLNTNLLGTVWAWTVIFHGVRKVNLFVLWISSEFSVSR